MAATVLAEVRSRLGRWRDRVMNPAAALELWQERAGSHRALPDHRPHIEAAAAWLGQAQDATPDDGVARGYSLAWNGYFRSRGWQPSYPEVTGYLIPTLYQLARDLGRPDLAERAERAARWEIAVHLPCGAVQGGVVGQAAVPAVFNTGQVVFGWLAAFRETGDPAFAAAATRAGRFLVDSLDADGHWRRGNSPYADARTTLYNTRTAWALAEAGLLLETPAFTAAAARHFAAVVRLPARNGWLPDCCLTDGRRPLLHTLAYAIRGFIEGGRVLGDARIIGRGALAAEHLLARVDPNGFMPGRFRDDWSPAAYWSCLTGQAQMAGVWLRLAEVTGQTKWLAPVPTVLRFLKSTQNRESDDPGLRGGIKGSFPLDGEYGRYEILSWATKFFIDALLRDQHRAAGLGTGDQPLGLA